MNPADQSRYKRPESVLVVVHTYDDVLLVERVGPPVFWQSVTGALEWDEAPLDAALRELEEETGIRNAAIRDTGVVRSFDIFEAALPLYAPGITRNREHLFYCPLSGRVDVRLSHEHSASKWMPIGEAIDEVLSWTNKLALRALAQRP